MSPDLQPSGSAVRMPYDSYLSLPSIGSYEAQSPQGLGVPEPLHQVWPRVGSVEQLVGGGLELLLQGGALVRGPHKPTDRNMVC